MTKKPLLTATFSDGRAITRRTDKPYTHAWRVIIKYANGGGTVVKGFACSRSLAAKQTTKYRAGGFWVTVVAEIAEVMQAPIEDPEPLPQIMRGNPHFHFRELDN